jgi:hypothetical protein
VVEPPRRALAPFIGPEKLVDYPDCIPKWLGQTIGAYCTLLIAAFVFNREVLPCYIVVTCLCCIFILHFMIHETDLVESG